MRRRLYSELAGRVSTTNSVHIAFPSLQRFRWECPASMCYVDPRRTV
jgi:hypothetical protein